MMASILAWINTYFVDAAGKKRNLALFILGGLATLGLAPFYAFPIMVAAIAILFLAWEHSDSSKRAFWTGWWFGFGYFALGLYWFAHALLTEPEAFGWLIPFAIFGIGAILALYTGFTLWLTYKVLLQKRLSKVCMFSLAWLVLEIARAHLFSGFPWNLIGYTWSNQLAIMQLASVTGVWGLSILTVFSAGLLACCVALGKAKFVTVKPALWVLGIWVCVALFGMMRLPSNGQGNTDASHTVRVVQANIAQGHRWDPAQRAKVVETHLEMTRYPGIEKISHVVWPESALPYFVEEGSTLLEVVSAHVPKGGLIISGGLRTDNPVLHSNVYNTLFAIGDNNQIATYYDKHHLVPFGEYVPLRSILPAGINKITHGMQDFSSGSGSKTLKPEGFVPFSPLICYEVIFPGNVADTNDRPELLVNVTNDAWFGMSTGPYQHYSMSRMRAVEEGLPLIRAANTGISAVIDPYGKVVGKTLLGERGVLDVPLPSHLPSPTIFSVWKSEVLLLIISIFGFLALFCEKNHFFCILFLQRKKT